MPWGKLNLPWGKLNLPQGRLNPVRFLKTREQVQ
jgi:hypothetical protein